MPNSLLTRKEVAHNLLQENLLKNIAKDRIFNNFLTKLTLIIGNLAFKVSSLDEFAKKNQKIKNKDCPKVYQTNSHTHEIQQIQHQSSIQKLGRVAKISHP